MSHQSFTRGGRAFWMRAYPFDVLSWVAAIVLAALLRYDFEAVRVNWQGIGRMILAAALLQLVFAYLLHAYKGRHPWGSFESVTDLFLVVALVGTTLWVVTLVFPSLAEVPRSLPVFASFLALFFMSGYRYLGRALHERSLKGKNSAAAVPVLVYGAGFVGDHLTRLLTTDAKGELNPVGFIDDDKGKAGLNRHGVPVLGTFQDLDRVLDEARPETIIVAIGSPSSELLARVHAAADERGLKVKVMPPTEQMLEQGVRASDLRDLKIEDLLGRPQVDTNVSQIAGYLNGKRVLVTGAGGSIGSQLCAEIAKHGPEELIMLDRDETGLQQTQIRIRGNGLLNSDEVVLADIRDEETLNQIFLHRRPEVVFHAAALKHLPMLEQYPDEAWQTNVLGSYHVASACRAAGVETLINISTDKAANPTSVLGLSKRLAERLVAWEGRDADRRYLSVRFGNVIGSRGSMLPTFYRLIEENRNLTVTHPDVTRYFMTIPEACQLVLQAGAIGRAGEVLILDMGEPVRILDIAEKMIALSGKPLKVTFTGLREGEKLHEDLHSDFEEEARPLHEKISHSPVDTLNPRDLTKAAWDILVAAAPQARNEAEHTIPSHDRGLAASDAGSDALRDATD